MTFCNFLCWVFSAFTTVLRLKKAGWSDTRNVMLPKLSLFASQGINVKGLKYLIHTLDVTSNESGFVVENKGLVDGLKSSVDGFKNEKKEKKTLSKNGKVSFKVSSLKKPRPETLTEYGLTRFSDVSAGLFGDASAGVFGDVSAGLFGDASAGLFGDVSESMHDGDNNTHW